MKKNLLLALLFVANIFGASAQTFEWARTCAGAGTPPADEISYSVIADALGNVYHVGFFRGNTNFNPPNGQTISPVGEADMFIKKLNSDGSFAWARTFGSIENDHAQDIAVDATGNVYITGAFSGTVDFDPSSAINNVNLQGQYNAFVLKLSAAGSLLWVKTVGNNFDFGQAIDLDAAGNIYTLGYASNTNLDINPNEGVFPANGNIFVQKLDLNGNFLNGTGFSANGMPRQMSVNASGEVAIAAANSTIKLNADLSVAWMHTLTNDANVHAVKIDNLGNLVAFGNFFNTVDFDPSNGILTKISNGQNDFFLSKYNANGTLNWNQTMGGANSEEPHDIDMDANGDIYLAGTIFGEADLDPSAGSTTFTPLGYSDAIIAKFKSNGDFLDAWAYGGGDVDVTWGIDVDANFNIYAAGYFYQTADLNPTNGVDTHTSAESADPFVLKMSQNIIVHTSTEMDISSKMNCFPNPMTKELSINLEKNYQIIRLEIIDMTGKIVMSENFSNLSTFKVSLSNLPAGAYNIKCIVNYSKIFVNKIIKI
jgi:hypothetical protein